MPLLISAQRQIIAVFKNVKMPFKLVCKDITFTKDKFDIHIYRAQEEYYLALKSKKKTLCLIMGTEEKYTDIGLSIYENPNIPENSVIKMKKNPQEGIVYFIFESGKKAKFYPFRKVVFKLEYQK